MDVKELIGYLEKFDPDETISFLAVDSTLKAFYPAEGYNFLDPKDLSKPVIILEVGAAKKLSEIAVEADRE